MTIERIGTLPPALQVSLDQCQFLRRVHTGRFRFVLARVGHNTAARLRPWNERQEIAFTRSGADRSRAREAVEVVEKGATREAEQAHIALTDRRHGIAFASMEDANNPVVGAALQV